MTTPTRDEEKIKAPLPLIILAYLVGMYVGVRIVLGEVEDPKGYNELLLAFGAWLIFAPVLGAKPWKILAAIKRELDS